MKQPTVSNDPPLDSPIGPSFLIDLLAAGALAEASYAGLNCERTRVRPEGAFHQWREVPPGELSIVLVADERLGRAIGRTEAS